MIPKWERAAGCPDSQSRGLNPPSPPSPPQAQSYARTRGVRKLSAPASTPGWASGLPAAKGSPRGGAAWERQKMKVSSVCPDSWWEIRQISDPPHEWLAQTDAQPQTFPVWTTWHFPLEASCDRRLLTTIMCMSVPMRRISMLLIRLCKAIKVWSLAGAERCGQNLVNIGLLWRSPFGWELNRGAQAVISR